MYDQTTLGIDISNKQISLALLSKTDNGIELLKSASAPVPEGAISGGNIKDAQLLAKAVKELCSRNKIPTRNAVVSLVAKPAILRVMELPKDLPGNPAQYIRDELKHYAVMSGKTIIHDFCALTPNKQTRTARLLLAAADEEKVADTVKAFNRVGINVTAVEPAVLACVRLLHANYIAKKFDSNVLIAVVQETTTTLCVFSNASLDFIRTVEIGADHLDTETGIQNLLNEIHAVRQFYDVEVEEASKKWEVIVSLARENQKYDALRQTLQDGLTDTSVHISSPATLSQDAQLSVTAKDQTSDASPASAGLAMKHFKTTSAELKINLLPARADEIHNMQKFALITIGAAIIVLILSFAAVSALRMKLAGVRQTIITFKQTQPSASTGKILADAAALDQKSKMLTEKIQTLNMIAGSSSAARDWAKILTDISSRTPKNVRIVNLTAKDNSTMHLSGQALSYDHVNNFVKLLGKSPYIASVKLVKSELDPSTKGLLSYNLTCAFSSGKGAANAN